jgi:hypothetical protein
MFRSAKGVYMRRALVTVVIASLAGLVLAAPAAPATPTEKALQRQVAALKKQVTTLGRQVTSLDKQVKTMKTQVDEQDDALGALFALTICGAAMTADAFQGTWGVIDQIAQPALQRTFFTPPAAAVNDLGACNSLRVPRSQAAPPTLSSFVAYLALFQS